LNGKYQDTSKENILDKGLNPGTPIEKDNFRLTDQIDKNENQSVPFSSIIQSNYPKESKNNSDNNNNSSQGTKNNTTYNTQNNGVNNIENGNKNLENINDNTNNKIQEPFQDEDLDDLKSGTWTSVKVPQMRDRIPSEVGFQRVLTEDQIKKKIKKQKQ